MRRLCTVRHPSFTLYTVCQSHGLHSNFLGSRSLLAFQMTCLGVLEIEPLPYGKLIEKTKVCALMLMYLYFEGGKCLVIPQLTTQNVNH